jgi:putative ABC transport system permease protein
MDRYYAESISQERLGAIVIALIAGFGLLMAVLGIYGVMAFVVNLRTHEIGLRMALGAAPRDILSLLLKQGLSLALTGLAIGLVVAGALSRVLSNLLTEVSVKEPAIYFGVAVILLASALLACYLPARRAMRVDPMVALRYE